MEILKVENLCKTYGTKKNRTDALKGISFSAEKGEFVAITGQSGSGKSTLLHLIGGVDLPTSGHIYVDGKEVFSRSAEQMAIFRRRQVGLVYQFYNLIPVLTAEENILLPLKLDGRKINRKRADELIAALGLADRKSHLPMQLSGGQQQRVSIGRALIHAPLSVSGRTHRKPGQQKRPGNRGTSEIFQPDLRSDADSRHSRRADRPAGRPYHSPVRRSDSVRRTAEIGGTSCGNSIRCLI